MAKFWDGVLLVSPPVFALLHPNPVHLAIRGTFPDLFEVGDKYLDLKEVYRKSCTTSLLPHWAYDFAIDILPGTTSLQGRLNSLSDSERLVIS